MKNIKMNGWNIEQNLENMNYYNESETIFAQANGYFGTRGSFEEGCKDEIEGTFINAFYDTEDIVYGEIAYGYAKKRQTQLLVPNTKAIKITLDNEQLNLDSSLIENHKRVLNLKNGEIIRSLVWTSKNNKKLEIEFSRFISMVHENLMVIKISFKALNFDGEINVKSSINISKSLKIDENDPRVSGDLKYKLQNSDEVKKDNFLIRTSKTLESNLGLLSAVLESDNNIKLSRGKTEQFIKYCFYYFDDLNRFEKNLDNKLKEFEELSKKGYDCFKYEQNNYYSEFWSKSDICIKGDDEIQSAIRFNIFHLIQSVGKNGKNNIAAKGLTGDGYEGHYFWDTEAYVIPYFIYNNPKIAKKLLEYRYSILENAKNRAKELSFKGALFPWRTINGEESSAYYPAGTAQIHINADIMYALKKYYEATLDEEFLKTKGFEMLLETSRFYADYADFIEGRGYCFNGVTGPDEYNALINNNTYTNMMIKTQLDFLLDILEKFDELKEIFNLKFKEISLFKDISEKIYIHYDKERNLIGQDDSFLNKKRWDFKNTPKENYPLLINYHPMVIYKHQVIKQADLVLAMLLMEDNFTHEEIKRNFDYYESATTHDSSLSECIHSIIAHKLGYYDMSYKFFENTVKTDLYDLHNNVKNGVHIASMAGSWQCIVFGFLGMRAKNDTLHFNPKLPEKLEEIKLRISFRNSILEVVLNKEKVSYNLISGEVIKVIENNKEIKLT